MKTLSVAVALGAVLLGYGLIFPWPQSGAQSRSQDRVTAPFNIMDWQPTSNARRLVISLAVNDYTHLFLLDLDQNALTDLMPEAESFNS
ncbi:hypothetical protein HC928_25710 [bacterium]|nr:hypothetical protein [bacterium]